MSNTPNLRPDGEARAPKQATPEPAFQVVNFFASVLNVPGMVDKSGAPIPTPEAKAVFTALEALTQRAIAVGFPEHQARRAIDFWLLDIGFSHLMKVTGLPAEVFQVGVPVGPGVGQQNKQAAAEAVTKAVNDELG